VILRTGFVLLEGSLAEKQLLDGFMAWLQFSGAGGSAGIPVGKGHVQVVHSTKYAVIDHDCDSYYAAARSLIEEKVRVASNKVLNSFSIFFRGVGMLS